MDLYTIRNQLASGKSIYDLPLKVTYYARVSTDKEEQKNSFANQIMYYENKINEIPNWTFVEGYVDEGISGTKLNKRDDFNRMVRDGKNQVFDLIMTKDICRFARNTVDTLTTTRELLEHGVGVFFETDNINTLSTEGELRLTIMASLAQDESRKMSERVRFGFKRSIEKGVVLGASNIWGYKKDNGKLVIDEEEAKIVRKVFELYSTGRYGIRVLGKELAKLGMFSRDGKVFTFSSIKGMLTNPKYKGYYCGNKTTKIDLLSEKVKYKSQDEWVTYKDETGEVVPAIVSEELWNKCNAIYKEHSDKMGKGTSYNTKYKYSGKLFCGNDGQSYWRTEFRNKVNGVKREAWQCREYKGGGKKACDSPTIYTKELDFILKNIFNSLFVNKDLYINELLELCKKHLTVNKYEQEIHKLEKKVENVKLQKKKVLHLYTTDKIGENDFKEINDNCNKELEDLEHQIIKFEEQKSKTDDINKNLNLLRECFNKEINMEDEDAPSYELVNQMIDRITVKKGDIPNLAILDVKLKIGYEIPIFFRKDLRLLLGMHIIKADIETEVSPIVGSEKQSEELVNYLLKEFEDDPIKIWQSNIFGKSLHELVNEGLQNKLYKMPEDAQCKLQETLERIINEGSGGLICIIL